MKIVIEIPGTAIALAAAAAADEYSEETIKKAIEKCNDLPTEINLTAMGMDKSDSLQLCMGLALFALAKAIRESDDSKSKEEAKKTGLAERLEKLESEAKK